MPRSLILLINSKKALNAFSAMKRIGVPVFRLFKCQDYPTYQMTLGSLAALTGFVY